MNKKKPIKKSTKRRQVWYRRLLDWVKSKWAKLRQRVRNFLARRPHRSFRLTRRRDYVRSFELPGYSEFTLQVSSILWKHKGIFAGLALVYSLASVLIGAAITQESYQDTQDILKEVGGDVFKGDFGALMQSGTMLASTLLDAFDPSKMDGVQQLYLVVFSLLTWLTTVWLLRMLLANKKPRLRDGLYNAAAPIVSTSILTLIAFLQLLPIGLMVLVYVVLTSGEFVGGGFGLMLLHMLLVVVAALSLYWVVSTAIALVVVTLPGMYPMQAMRTAGDLVVGRRLRVLLRLLWAAMIVVGFWLIVAIPTIMFDGWLKETWSTTQWIPIVPVVISLLISLTIVWMSAYIYLLYRRMVDDGAKPA